MQQHKLKKEGKDGRGGHLHQTILLTVYAFKRFVDKKHFLTDRAIIGINSRKEICKKNGTGFGAQYLDLDKPSFSIPARYHKDGYDALVKINETTIRRLTLLELKRIQTFPDNFIIDGSSKKEIITQICNSTSCRFAYHMGIHIQNLLTNISIV